MSPRSHPDTLLRIFKKIPYENISKIFRLGLASDKRSRTSALLMKNFNENGWGGTCFSLTWAAHQALKHENISCRIVKAPMPRQSFPHFALIYTSEDKLYFIDPGYMIFEGIVLSKGEDQFYSNGVMDYICEFDQKQNMHSISSLQNGNKNFRYFIDLDILTDEDFQNYWKNSFQYMDQTVCSRIQDDKFIYIAGDYAQIRTKNHSERYEGFKQSDKLIKTYFNFTQAEIDIAREILRESGK